MTDADFENMLEKIRSTYGDMKRADNPIGLRVSGYTDETLIAFERFLRELPRHEPKAETGHVLEAVTSLVTTIVAAFCGVASDKSEDEELHSNFVRSILLTAYLSLTLPPEDGPQNITIIGGGAN